jgi:hypothetical protein
MGIDIYFSLDEVVSVFEGIHVGSGGPVHEPGDTLETSTSVDDLYVKVFTRTIVEGLVLHEHHVSDFETTHEVLNGRSEVTTTGPDIFNVSNLIGVDAQSFSEPSVVVLKAFILEILKIVLVVEDLVTHHDEARVMTSSHTNVIQIIEANAELGADQRVGRRVKFTSHTVRLETENTSSHVIYIISPSSDHRVSLNSSARDFLTTETVPEALPALGVGVFLIVLA